MSIAKGMEVNIQYRKLLSILEDKFSETDRVL